MIGTKFKTTARQEIVGTSDCLQIIIIQDMYADLKRDFEIGEMGIKISVSLTGHISTSDQASEWQTSMGKSKVYH